MTNVDKRYKLDSTRKYENTKRKEMIDRTKSKRKELNRGTKQERSEAMNKVTRTTAQGRPSKLTEKQKDTVVNHFNQGQTQKFIAEEFGVSVSTIRAVLRERR